MGLRIIVPAISLLAVLASANDDVVAADADVAASSDGTAAVGWGSRRRRRRTYTPAMCHNFNGCMVCLGPCQDGQAVSGNCQDHCQAFAGTVSGICQSEQVQGWTGDCNFAPVPTPATTWQVELTQSMHSYVAMKAAPALPGLCEQMGQGWNTCDCWTETGAPQGTAPMCNSPPGCTVFGANPIGNFNSALLLDSSTLDAQLASWKLPEDVNKQFQIAKVAESVNFTTFHVGISGTGVGELTEYVGVARTDHDSLQLGYVMATTQATLAVPMRAVPASGGRRRRRRRCSTVANSFTPAQMQETTALMDVLAFRAALLHIPHATESGIVLDLFRTSFPSGSPVHEEAPVIV